MTKERPLKRPGILRAVQLGAPLRARWGYVGVSPHDRGTLSGERTATIYLYPPGITRGTRRLLHVWRSANVLTLPGGAAAGLLALLCVAATSSLWLGLTIAAAFIVAAHVVVLVATRRARASVRTIRIYGRDQPGSPWGDVEVFEAVAAQLDALDGAGYDSVQYEAEWWRIYSAIDPNR